jgi:hypothetical protein
MFIGEWMLARAAPTLAAQFVYLHVSGFVPVLASGFWLIVTEEFDPRTAKRRFGQIAAVGTLGGVVGGLLADRVAAYPRCGRGAAGTCCTQCGVCRADLPTAEAIESA